MNLIIDSTTETGADLEKLCNGLLRDAITCIQKNPVCNQGGKRVTFIPEILQRSINLICHFVTSGNHPRERSFPIAIRSLCKSMKKHDHQDKSKIDNSVAQILDTYIDWREQNGEYMSAPDAGKRLGFDLSVNISHDDINQLSPLLIATIQRLDPTEISINNQFKALCEDLLKVNSKYREASYILNHETIDNHDNSMPNTAILSNHFTLSQLVQDGHVNPVHAYTLSLALTPMYFRSIMDIPETDHGTGRVVEMLHYLLDTGYMWAFNHDDLREILDTTDLPVALVFKATNLERLYPVTYNASRSRAEQVKTGNDPLLSELWI